MNRVIDTDIVMEYEKAQNYVNRGMAKLGLEMYEQAIDDFDRAILIMPEFAAAYHARASAKKLFGREKEAAADTAEAIRLDPGILDEK